MKDEKSSQKNIKRNAENWVEIARKFGEKCVAIQHDIKLTLDQKLEKQQSLSKEMIKEIHNDPYLKSEDKTVMEKSINSYIEDWTKMHNILQTIPADQPEMKKHKK